MDDGTWDNNDHEPWKVPDYLHNLYVIWTLVGDALSTTSVAHHGAHRAEEGYYSDKLGAERPPDTLVTAMLARPIDIEVQKDDGTPITIHDALGTAIASLQLVTIALVEHIRDLGALPPWWQEEFDALSDGVDMWAEEDDDDGA